MRVQGGFQKLSDIKTQQLATVIYILIFDSLYLFYMKNNITNKGNDNYMRIIDNTSERIIKFNHKCHKKE